MYSTFKLKNGINVDILRNEVIAWTFDLEGRQETVCRREYKNDDDLVILLEEIRKRVNYHNHGEIWDFLFKEFYGWGKSVTYAENGSLIVKANGNYSPAEYFAKLERLEEIEGVRLGFENASSMMGTLSTSIAVYDFGQEVARIFY